MEFISFRQKKYRNRLSPSVAMPNQISDAGRPQAATLKERLRENFTAGLAAARDPANAGLPNLALQTTTIYSPWFTRPCPECKDKFREDDRVRLCPLCKKAYHDDKQFGLDCWLKHFDHGQICTPPRRDPITETETVGCQYRWDHNLPDEKQNNSETVSARRFESLTRQFLQGMEREWKPFGEQEMHRAAKGDGVVGLECPWCRLKIRAGEYVVKCPCGKCNTYFHDDITRHLTCWNDWNGAKGMDFCPTSGARIEAKESQRGPIRIALIRT